MNEIVKNYNNNIYQECLNDLRPADVYFGRLDKILEKRTIIKQKQLLKEDNYINKKKH